MITVGIASSDSASAAQVIAALQQTGIAKCIKQWTLPFDKPLGAATGLPDVVLLDLARDTEPFFAFGAQIRRVRPATKLIALSAVAAPPQQLMLEAMRGGVQELLPKPVSVDVLKDVLSRFLQEADSQQPSLDKLIVVMGAKGGVGTTTIAVNLGVELSAFAHKHATLLDFAQPLGNAHLLLDVHPQFGIRAAVENLERLDSHFFAGLLTAHKTNLQLLAGATQPEEWQSINVAALERVVNVAQNNFDMVLVDMGSQFSGEWSPILKMARMILIVSETNVPSLWSLHRRLVALTGLGIEPDRARIVINRWQKTDEHIVKSIQHDINRPVFAVLPNDYRRASESVNLGTPLVGNQANGLGTRYRQIAAQIAGIGGGPAPKKSGLSGFFSFSHAR